MCFQGLFKSLLMLLLDYINYLFSNITSIQDKLKLTLVLKAEFRIFS